MDNFSRDFQLTPVYNFQPMLQIKALYNLLRLNARQNQPVKAEPWALEDLRTIAIEQLWRKLTNLKISIDKDSFLRFANECDSPEQLADLLVDENQPPEAYDRLYLILFELWRRLLPERPSLSIFCDELDHRIDLYDSESVVSDEHIQDGLANLLEILEEHVDLGMPPKKAFSSVSEYCANDLESFLFDYITELLDQNNTLYALELLEEFTPYISELSRFHFLEARLLSFTDIKEANRKMKALLVKESDPDLLFDLLRLLVTSGEHDLFQMAMRKLLPHLKTEEELNEVIDLAADYYRRLDQDEFEQAIMRIKNQPIPDMAQFQKLIFSKMK